MNHPRQLTSSFKTLGKMKVPPVLLSGDHKKIEEWREKMMGGGRRISNV